MSIITIQNGDVQPTVEQKQANKRVLITSKIQSSFNQVIKDYKEMFDLVWKSSDLTPQEIFDGFGTDAAQLFLIAGAFKDAVNTVAPDTLTEIPAPSYTINEDGSVSINN